MKFYLLRVFINYFNKITMKKLLSSLLFLILLTACKKEPLYLKYFWGDVSGIKINGINWPSHSDWTTKIVGEKLTPTPDCNFTLAFIRIETYTSDDFKRESLGIGGLPLKTGKYILKNSSSFRCDSLPATVLNLSTADGDAGVGNYIPLKGADNSVTITSYDAATNEVRGTFDITFVKNYLGAFYDTNYTDTIRFNGGQFHTRWIE